MNVVSCDRRIARSAREDDLKRTINPEQGDMLRSLEQFGWSLRFVRRQGDGTSTAVVYDPDKKVLAIIEADGQLVENPRVPFRI